MSQLNVDTIGAQTGNDISIASGKTLKDASGNAFITSAGVLQVVTQQATVDLSGDGAEIDIAPMDITITPQTTSSAIMVGLGSIPIQVADRNDNNYWGIKIYRTIGSGSASVIQNSDQMGRAYSSGPSTQYRDGQGLSFIDKPNTTSQCVYEFRFIQNTHATNENSHIGKGVTCTSYGIEFSGATEV